MSDTNTQQDGGTQAPATDADTSGEERKVYATREDAEKEKPAKAGKHAKVYTVTKGGTVVGYIWANGYAECGTWAARKEGYTFSASGKAKAPVTKDAVASFLAGMSDEDRAALIAQYVPAPAPAPVGRGKKGQQQ
jgi:hypothetical protein